MRQTKPVSLQDALKGQTLAPFNFSRKLPFKIFWTKIVEFTHKNHECIKSHVTCIHLSMLSCHIKCCNLESFNHLRAPGYLADDFRLAGRGRPGSPSAASMMLDIPRTTTSLGDSICRRRTACLEQPSSCNPWSVTVTVVVNLRKAAAAENLFVCLRVAALVTYELAPYK